MIAERECGECTACCEGRLSGTIHGHVMKPGVPCHFLGQGQCTIYKSRPEEPCKRFVCAWLDDKAHELPEWLKPSLSKVIITKKTWAGGVYWNVLEAGQKMDSEVLSWIIQHCIKNDICLKYEVSGGYNYIGTPEFLEEMSKQ